MLYYRLRIDSEDYSVNRSVFVLLFFFLMNPVDAKVLNPSNGHYYDIVPIPANFTWHQARDSCFAMGGYLATVTDQEEQDFIYSVLLSVVSPECWLGGTDEGNEGIWNWVNGEPFNFTYWYQGEPNDANGGEDYTSLVTGWSGRWNDSREWFNVSGHFVVEWDPCCVGIRGDVNGDGPDANILDLNQLVGYIFRGSGNSGPCPEESDVNGDGNVANILDLNYLVNVIFRGGPIPPSCAK